MTVRIDPEIVRQERHNRGWSQLHLATVTGLGLRTVQRMEQTGAASYESAQALAACFEIPLDGLAAAERAAEERPRGFIARRTAVLGMASSFAAGALLMTMHGVAAEDIFLDLGVSVPSAANELRTQVYLDDGERFEYALPRGYRIAITPKIAADDTVRFEFEIYDDSQEPARLISQPAIVTMNGKEFRIVQGTGSGPAASGDDAADVLDITGIPVLLDDARRIRPAAEAETER